MSDDVNSVVDQVVVPDAGPRESAVPAHIRALPLYVPGRSEQAVAREFGLTRIVKLASNENPLGCSPDVGRALAEHASRSDGALARYPDSDAYELRHALAQYHGVSADHIAVTNGSHELVDLCAAVSLREGLAGLYSQYAFQAYPISIKARGANAIEVPARHFGHDPDAICAALSTDVNQTIRLVYICNPNNPTGTLLAHEQIERIVRAAGAHRLVVLDEAYIDYVDVMQRADTAALVACYPQLVVARTFSKAYGLASLRIGYGVMHPDLADAIARVRPTFSVNALAQRAALAALADRAFLQRTQDVNRRGIEQITRALDQHGIPFIPTHANFIAIRLRDAKAVTQRLLQAGVVVRPLGAYELNDLIRVTIGTEAENALFLQALFDAIG
jgi:histidinol-phosphate aminotransferase